MASALLRGVLLGVVIAAPVGPMALLAIRRTLDHGWARGVASGLGIATADGIYAAVAALGLTAASSLLLAHSREVQLAGGVLIVLLGARGLVAGVGPAPADATDRGGLATAYASCLGLTLANPPTILSFAALMAGVGVVTAGPGGGFALAVGVFVGSAAWWIVLTGGVARARSWIGERWRRRVTRGAALALVLLGVGVLGAGLRGRA